MKIKIEFNNNQGSFALDALATTFGGNWSGKSSTDTSGIITDVPSEDKEWVESVLNEDENVLDFTIED